MNFPSINIGDELTCAETGKQFIAAPQGCTFNYARTLAGEILSDDGASIREKRALLDRASPFYCYVSGDALHVTDWKGNTLGRVSEYRESRNGFHRSTIARFRVRDVHGQLWSGRGPGRSMCCVLRAMKG
jgi:hypothetical protein